MVFASDILKGHNSAHAQGPVSGFLGQAVTNIQLWREFSKTQKELSALSDRSLADLGINRSEIHSVARRAVYGQQF